MRMSFDEVSIKAVYRWKEGAKTRQRTRKFWQTINPFNKNPDGSVKTRDQIMAELMKQRDEWLDEQKKGGAA